MSNPTMKYEKHKGRDSWVVAGMIRTYSRAEALRLVAGSDEPIVSPAPADCPKKLQPYQRGLAKSLTEALSRNEARGDVHVVLDKSRPKR